MLDDAIRALMLAAIAAYLAPAALRLPPSARRGARIAAVALLAGAIVLALVNLAA